MKYKSQLALIVATQLGAVQGRLESTLVTRLTETVNRYSRTCPTVGQLNQTVSLLNNISNSLAALEKSKNSFGSTVNRLAPIISSLTTLVTVLRSLPIPTAIAGVGVPIGFTNRYAELLVNTSEFLTALKDEQSTILKLINSSESTTERVSQLVTTLQSILTNCITSNPDLKPYLENLQQAQNNLLTSDTEMSNLGLGPNNSYRASNGRMYFFEIVNDTSVEAPVIRRQAIARDSTGVVIIKGEPSFSSSTKVLIDELKLRIERQLP
jgi:hypothetical protein